MGETDLNTFDENSSPSGSLPTVSRDVRAWAEERYDAVVIPPLSFSHKWLIPSAVSRGWSRGVPVVRVVIPVWPAAATAVVVLAIGSTPIIAQGTPLLFQVFWAGICALMAASMVRRSLGERRAGPLLEVAGGEVRVPRLSRSFSANGKPAPVLIEVSETVTYKDGAVSSDFAFPAVELMDGPKRTLVILPARGPAKHTRRVLGKLLPGDPLVHRVTSQVRCRDAMPTGD